MQTSLNSIPTDNAYALIVIGGGPSGAIAATAAARLGVKTLLIEKHGFLGGSLTAMGVGPMMSFHNGEGKQVVKGLPQLVIDRLMEKGASPGHIPDSITYCSTVTPFDSEYLKIELESLFTEAGGTLLYHTHLADVETRDGVIHSLVVCNKAGLTRFTADVFIDASGDGDFAAMAGAPFMKGRDKDGVSQPMTMNLKVGNVAIDRIKAYVKAHPEEFFFKDGAAEGLRRLESSHPISLGGFLSLWRDAKARGEVDVPRGDVLFFETATPGVIIVNTSRIQGLDATNPFDLSKAEMEGRRQCAQIFNFLKKYCPGFEEAIFIGSGPQIGVRESRHVRGLHVLTAEELVAETRFPDAIAAGGYPIDIHSPDGEGTNSVHLAAGAIYTIPARSLMTDTPSNLVVVGRCISATHEAAAAFRVTPIAMAIGQGGGTLAALAIQRKSKPADVPYEALRDVLEANGAYLNFPTPV